MLQITFTQEALARARQMMSRAAPDEAAYVVRYKGKPCCVGYQLRLSRQKYAKENPLFEHAGLRFSIVDSVAAAHGLRYSAYLDDTGQIMLRELDTPSGGMPDGACSYG